MPPPLARVNYELVSLHAEVYPPAEVRAELRAASALLRRASRTRLRSWMRWLRTRPACVSCPPLSASRWAAAADMWSPPSRSCSRRATAARRTRRPPAAPSPAAQSAKPSCVATDTNPHAVAATRRTLQQHGVEGEVVLTDLAAGLESRLAGRVDVLLFNPPYVPSPPEEVRAGGALARRRAHLRTPRWAGRASPPPGPAASAVVSSSTAFCRACQPCSRRAARCTWSQSARTTCPTCCSNSPAWAWPPASRSCEPRTASGCTSLQPHVYLADDVLERQLRG